MTAFGLGVLVGAVCTFIAMVALILLVNHGPGEKAWRYLEDDE
jgi:hypothetical protein